jgi:hypothetical protein
MNWKKPSWGLLAIGAAFALAAGAAAQTMIEAIPRADRPPAPAVGAPSFGANGSAQDAAPARPGSRNESVVAVPDSEIGPDDTQQPATDDSDDSTPQVPEAPNPDQ